MLLIRDLTLRTPALGAALGVAWGLDRNIPRNGIHTPQPTVQRASGQEGRLRDSLVISENFLCVNNYQRMTPSGCGINYLLDASSFRQALRT